MRKHNIINMFELIINMEGKNNRTNTIKVANIFELRANFLIYEKVKLAQVPHPQSIVLLPEKGNK